LKWIFLAGLLVLTPLLATYLRNHRQYLPKAAFVLALLPFIEMRLNVTASPYTWPMWQGFVKGIDVSLTDSLAIAMILAGRHIKTPLRLKLALGFYVIVFILSTAVAEIYLPSVFYGWQLIRVVLVYYAVARASAIHRDVPAYLLTGLIAGLSIQAVIVMQQKLGGQLQAGGWFGHQNLLGMASHFVVYPAFAAFLGGYYVRRTALCVVAAFVVAWAGGSRATIGLMCIGLALTILLSCWRRASSRKTMVAGLGMLCMVAAVPLLYGAVERRSAELRAGSSEERERMRSAATMIIADYPLGVGANRFVAVANVGGYYARAGVVWTSVAALVHNTYYLVAAEMGLLGLLAFIILLVAVLSLAWSNIRRAPPGFGSEYAIGTTVTVLAVAAHSYYEWITMYYIVHSLLAMNVAVMVALRASLPKKNSFGTLDREEPTGRFRISPAAT
jgi:O-antigen ligase